MEKVLLACALGVATAGAVTDLRTRRIPNWLTYSAIVTAVLARMLAFGWPGVRSSLLGLIGGGAILMFLFLLGGIGGGDVKLMAAVGAWVGGAQVLSTLAAAAVAGAFLGCGVMLFRGRARVTLGNIVEIIRHHMTFGLTPHPELNVRESRAVRVPFAPAIAVGALYSAGLTLFWG